MVGWMEPRYLAGLPLAVLFIAAGQGHFMKPRFFIGIMKGMPLEALHPAANYITGVMELVGGVALLSKPSPQVVYSLFWLVVIMSAANVNMWWNDVPAGKTRMTYGFPFGTHYLRAYAQIALLLWLHYLAKAHRAGADGDKSGDGRMS